MKITPPLECEDQEAKAVTKIKFWGAPSFDENDDITGLSVKRYKASFKINSESDGSLGPLKLNGKVISSQAVPLQVCDFLGGDSQALSGLVQTASIKSKGELSETDIPWIFGGSTPI